MTAIGKSQLPKAAVLLFTNALGAALSVCFANFSKHIINGATEYKDWGYVVRYAVYLLILIMVGMCTQERFFCQFLCPMGAVFAIMPIIPGALFKRNRPNCASKCTLCKKRCPAHLDIDGDTAHSGECICCHACQAICPKQNIHTGDA